MVEDSAVSTRLSFSSIIQPNMNMDNEKGKNPLDSRMAEDRRLGGVVPATQSSSSCKGQATELLASSVDLDDIAQNLHKVGELVNEMGRRDSETEILGMPTITMIKTLEQKIKMKKRRAPILNSGSEEADASILISSEDEMLESGSSTGKSSKRGGRNKKRRKPNSPPQRLNEEEEEIQASFNVLGKTRVQEETSGLEIAHASEVFERMKGWLCKIEELRSKSKNIKGSYSGQMKVLIESCKRAGIVLSKKASSTEDPEFWKNQFEEQNKKNLEYEIEISNLKKEIQMLKSRQFIQDAYSDRSSSKKSSPTSKQNSSRDNIKNREVTIRTRDKTLSDYNIASGNAVTCEEPIIKYLLSIVYYYIQRE